MNPDLRVEYPSLTSPDIASAPRPKRGVGGILGTLSGLIALYGTTGMAPRIVFAQTGPDQNNEQVVDPNQFTDPMVAGVLAEVEIGVPEDSPDGENPPVNPEPTLTPTPTPEVKAPTDVINFHIQTGVTPEVAEVVHRGMLNAQAWGKTNLGITGMRPVDVYVNAGDPGPNPMGNTESDGRIIFYPRHYQWTHQTPKRLFSGMGHELAHHWQYSRSNLTSFRDEITWIVEGFADYIGFRIAVDQKFLTMEEMEGCFALYTKSSRPQPPPLSQLESRIGWDAAQGSGYWPAELAAHYLSTKYGTNTLITFFDQLPQAGNNWEQAFRMTFGQSLEDFYLEFNRYVTSLPLPGNNPCIDTGMMYQPGK